MVSRATTFQPILTSKYRSLPKHSWWMDEACAAKMHLLRSISLWYKKENCREGPRQSIFWHANLYVYKSIVGVIPKEGLAGSRLTILLRYQRWATPVSPGSDSISRPTSWLRFRLRLQLLKNWWLRFRLRFQKCQKWSRLQAWLQLRSWNCPSCFSMTLIKIIILKQAFFAARDSHMPPKLFSDKDEQ